MPRGWPFFDLRVVTPRLVLRVASDEQLERLAERAAGRVLEPAQAGFMGPWTQLPSPEFERNVLQYHWGVRAALKPESWSLELGVFPTGHDEPVGSMAANATHFARLRSVSTGSWLLPEWRAQGLGREARAAMLHLAFAGLGAREARSGAHPGNAASNGVSRSLGYRVDGTEPIVTGGDEPVYALRLLLRREDWEAQRRDDIELVGLDACLPLLGVDGP